MNVYQNVKLIPLGTYPTNVRCKATYLQCNIFATTWFETEKNRLEIGLIEKGLVELSNIHLYNRILCSPNNERIEQNAGMDSRYMFNWLWQRCEGNAIKVIVIETSSTGISECIYVQKENKCRLFTQHT